MNHWGDEIRELIDGVEPVSDTEARHQAALDAPTTPDPGVGVRRQHTAVIGAAAAVVCVAAMAALLWPTDTSRVETGQSAETGAAQTTSSSLAGPPPTVLPPVGDDPIVTCRTLTPVWFPLSAWTEPTTADTVDHPATAVFDRIQVIQDMARENDAPQPFPNIPLSSWYLLTADDSDAVWGSGDFDLDEINTGTLGPFLWFLKTENIDGDWHYAGGPAGSCNELFVQVPDGMSVARWMTRSAPDPEATSLAIVVSDDHPMWCGPPLSPDEVAGPDVVETADSVSIRVAIRRPPPTDEDLQRCMHAERSERTPVTVEVELAEPLGDRALLDANRYPPQPVHTQPVRDEQRPGGR